MFCRNCGKQINDGTTFCIYCGTKVKAAEPSTPQVEPVTPAMQSSVENTQPIPVISEEKYPEEFMEYVNKQNIDLDAIDDAHMKTVFENWKSGKTSLNALIIDKYQKKEEQPAEVNEPVVIDDPVVVDAEVVEEAKEEVSQQPIEEPTTPEVSDYSEEVSSIKEQLASIQQEKEALEKNVKELSDENALLKSSLESSEATYNQLKEQYDKIVEGIKNLINS